VPIRAVFESPTIRNLRLASKTAGKRRPHCGDTEKIRAFAVVVYQQRLCSSMNCKAEPGIQHGGGAALRGRLDVDALGRTIQTIVDRHESLRTHFGEEQSAVQIVAPNLLWKSN